MNIEFFIARRIYSQKNRNTGFGKSVIKITQFAIFLSMAVMILAVAIITGFKKEITNKTIGFGSHIQLVNQDLNTSFETVPININKSLEEDISAIKGVKHIQKFATKSGIIKTDDAFQGVVLKGISEDFNWSFFKRYMSPEDTLILDPDKTNNEIIISKSIAQKLKLKEGDKIRMIFIQNPPRFRAFTIKGVYNTGLEEFDRLFILCDIRHIRSLSNWNEQQISGYEVFLNDFKEIEKVNEEIFEDIAYNFQDDGASIMTKSIIESYPGIFDWLRLIDANVWIVLGLMILIAGFNMISGLLIIILERTNMIGIFKAMGSKNWSIRRIFMYQSVFLILRSVFYGNLLGIALCLIQKYFKIIPLNAETYYVDAVPVILNVWHLLALNLGTLLITFLILIIPTQIISKLSPAKTIRFN